MNAPPAGQAVSPLTGAPTPTSGGRPPGTRNFITKELIARYTEAFEKHGPKALEIVARTEPAKFLQLGFGILPRDVLVSVIEQRRPGGLSAEDWALMLKVLDMIKSCIAPDANAPPAEVFSIIENALRSHFAKEIDG
jgi:hypothetical protein